MIKFKHLPVVGAAVLGAYLALTTPATAATPHSVTTNHYYRDFSGHGLALQYEGRGHRAKTRNYVHNRDSQQFAFPNACGNGLVSARLHCPFDHNHQRWNRKYNGHRTGGVCIEPGNLVLCLTGRGEFDQFDRKGVSGQIFVANGASNINVLVSDQRNRIVYLTATGAGNDTQNTAFLGNASRWGVFTP